MSKEEILDIMKNLTLYDYDFNIKSKYVQGHDETATMMGNEAIEGLLDLYNEEKEKNASLQKEIKLMKSININDNYISKDKIREHLKNFEEIEKEFIFIDNKSTAREINKALIKFSKRLLEE